jgi:hypothetical protein
MKINIKNSSSYLDIEGNYQYLEKHPSTDLYMC